MLQGQTAPCTRAKSPSPKRAMSAPAPVVLQSTCIQTSDPTSYSQKADLRERNCFQVFSKKSERFFHALGFDAHAQTVKLLVPKRQRNRPNFFSQRTEVKVLHNANHRPLPISLSINPLKRLANRVLPTEPRNRCFIDDKKLSTYLSEM